MTRGKRSLQPRGVEVRRVQIHVIAALEPHLGDHGAHDDVARGELGARVVRGHEALSRRVAQIRAFAAQRLGDELHRLLAGHRETRRVELHELEVADRGAGAVRHGDAVAGRHRRVGGASVHLTGAACGQHGDHGHVEGEPAVVEVERERPDAAPLDGEKVDDELVLVELYAAAHAGRLGEGARHLAAGGVAAGVHDAGHRVRALAAEHDLPVDLVEARADVHELPHAVGALVDQHADGLLVAEAGAGVDGVLEVQLGRVGRAQRRGDASLREERRGVVEGRLGEQPDAPAARGGDGGREAGDAAAEHEHVERAPVQGLSGAAGDVRARHGRPPQPPVRAADGSPVPDVAAPWSLVTAHASGTS